MLGVAEGEVVSLDGEDVREVGPELERELELDGPRRVVLDDDVLLHAVADEAVATDGELVRPEPVDDGVPQVERRGEVVDAVRGEGQGPRAVDGEHPAREEARVAREEAHDRLGDVAAVVRDAERRAFQDRESH